MRYRRRIHPAAATSRDLGRKWTRSRFPLETKPHGRTRLVASAVQRILGKPRTCRTPAALFGCTWLGSSAQANLVGAIRPVAIRVELPRPGKPGWSVLPATSARCCAARENPVGATRRGRTRLELRPVRVGLPSWSRRPSGLAAQLRIPGLWASHRSRVPLRTQGYRAGVGIGEIADHQGVVSRQRTLREAPSR